MLRDILPRRNSGGRLLLAIGTAKIAEMFTAPGELFPACHTAVRDQRRSGDAISQCRNRAKGFRGSELYGY